MSIRIQIKASGKFDAEKVKRAIDRKMNSALFRAGGLIRTIAKRSLRPARKIRLSELPDEDREQYREEMEDYRNGYRERPPVLRDIISDPGNPPLLHMKPSPLRQLLRFFVEKDKTTVVIGPERAKDAIAGELEHGRGAVKAARPFMAPAMVKALPKLPQFLRSAVNN